jgi:hypothetical protein
MPTSGKGGALCSSSRKYHPIADVRSRNSLLTGRDTGSLWAEIGTIGAWLTEATEEPGLKEMATGKFYQAGRPSDVRKL